MDRLRKSFRRKGKEKGGAKQEIRTEEAVDACTVSELSLNAPPPSRIDRFRKSLRWKSKNKKKKEESVSKEEENEDPIEIEPFDKKSKFRRSLSFKKKKNKEKKKPPSKFEREDVKINKILIVVNYSPTTHMLSFFFLQRPSTLSTLQKIFDRNCVLTANKHYENPRNVICKVRKKIYH